jgi:hypothetical protein
MRLERTSMVGDMGGLDERERGWIRGQAAAVLSELQQDVFADAASQFACEPTATGLPATEHAVDANACSEELCVARSDFNFPTSHLHYANISALTSAGHDNICQGVSLNAAALTTCSQPGN